MIGDVMQYVSHLSQVQVRGAEHMFGGRESSKCGCRSLNLDNFGAGFYLESSRCRCRSFDFR